MSDFRVPVEIISEYNEDLEQELDWDRNERSWTLSEREMQLGQKWLQNLAPNTEQIQALFGFFRIEPGSIQEKTILKLSPGELALIHRNTVSVPSVYAFICEKCGQHWYVFRWEEKLQRWSVYGRNCDFSWNRGRRLEEDEITMLRQAGGSVSDPLYPS